MRRGALILFLVRQVHLLNIWDSSTGINCQIQYLNNHNIFLTNLEDNGKDRIGHTYEEHQEYCRQQELRGFSSILEHNVPSDQYDQYEEDYEYRCTIEGNSIVCNKLDYSKYQRTGLKGFPKNYDDINFAMSIPNLNAHFFWSQNFILSVKIINLNNVHIKTIEPTAFNGLHNVETLNLQNNEIEQLGNLFGPLNALKVLNLGNNSITDIQAHTFASLSKLKMLILAHNNITYIEEQSFKYQIELAELDLSNNPLHKFSFKTLILLNSLEVLYMNNAQLKQKSVSCKINNVEEDCGTLPIFIKNISLVGNAFTEINDLSHLSNLEKIVLSNNSVFLINTIFGNEIIEILLDYNNLTTLPNALFSKATKLRKLDLNHNHINDLNESIFQNTTSLITLSLSQNNLTQLPVTLFKNLNNLIYLNLSRNYLTNIPVELFDGLAELEILDLSFNRLKTLHRITFHALQNLSHLYIENNLINQFKFAKWLLPQLKQMSIHGNPWICDHLLDMYADLKDASVQVIDGSNLTHIRIGSVNGIGCIEENVTKDSTSEDEIDQIRRTLLNVTQNLSQLINCNYNATLSNFTRLNKEIENTLKLINLKNSYPNFSDLNVAVNQTFENFNTKLNTTIFNTAFNINENLTKILANINNNIESSLVLIFQRINTKLNITSFNKTFNIHQNLSDTFANVNNNIKSNYENVSRDLNADLTRLFKNFSVTLKNILNSSQENLKSSDNEAAAPLERKESESSSVFQIINTLMLISMFALILFYFVTNKMLTRRQTLEASRELSEVELL